MSLVWGQALHKAYPEQVGRYRPSGIGRCARQQAASVHNIPHTNDNWSGIWQQQLGHSGQDVAINAFKEMGFKLKILEDGDDGIHEYARPVGGILPGEADLEFETLPGNMLSLPVDEIWLGEVKLRGVYPYDFIWTPEYDMMNPKFDPGAGMQGVVYAAGLGVKRILWIVAPFDSTAVRNSRKFSKKNDWYGSEYVRFLVGEFNPELYAVAVTRKAELETYGLKVAPEYNPNENKFPCTYCPVMQWCIDKGPDGEVITPVPNEGMPVEMIDIL